MADQPADPFLPEAESRSETKESRRVDPALEPYEVIAARKGTEKWKFRATAAYHRWAEGKEVTEADFDAAVEQMLKGSVLGPA